MFWLLSMYLISSLLGMDVIELTRKLVGFNTINPPGNEEACAHFIGDLLQKEGFVVSYPELAPGRPNVIARINGVYGKPICLSGHIDVVPLGTAHWQMDPFKGEIKDGRMYGRGTADMKGGLAALLCAALTLKDEAAKTTGMVLVLTAGEERGCDGANALVAQHRNELGTAGALLVGEPTNNYPLIGHRGCVWLNAQTSGITAHGSMPEKGDNAIYKAAIAIEKLRTFKFSIPHHPLVGDPSLNVGTIKGGLNINSVPDSVSIGIDIRTIPGLTYDIVIRSLQKLLGDEVSLSPIINAGSVASDPQDPWIQNVFAIAATHLPQPPVPRAAPYFTDAAPLCEAFQNPPTIIMGPGEPWMAHVIDESCPVHQLHEAETAFIATGRAYFKHTPQ